MMRSTFIVAAILIALTHWVCVADVTPKGEFDFVQISDPQLGKVSMEHDTGTLTTAIQLVNNLDPPADFVVFSGDLIDTAKSDDTLNEFNSIVSGLNIPYYCGVGNNDLGGGSIDYTLAHFRTIIGPDYMTFEHAGFLFVFLNTQLWVASLSEEIAAQDAWLDGVWTTSAGKPKFVIGHHPLYAESPSEADNVISIPLAYRASLLNDLTSNNVVAYLSGHTHTTIVNDYQGIQLVTSGTTSRNYDTTPLGFRLWHVRGNPPYESEWIALDDPTGSRDQDHDGLTEAQEDINRNGVVDSNETDPYNPDTDGDGLEDGYEVAHGTNPLVDDVNDQVPALGLPGILLAAAVTLRAGRRFVRK